MEAGGGGSVLQHAAMSGREWGRWLGAGSGGGWWRQGVRAGGVGAGQWKSSRGEGGWGVMGGGG